MNYDLNTEGKISSDNVQFEEAPLDTGKRKVLTRTYSKMAEYLMRSGIIKSEKGANIVLLALAALFFILAVLMLLLGAVKIPPETYINSINTLRDAKVQIQY